MKKEDVNLYLDIIANNPFYQKDLDKISGILIQGIRTILDFDGALIALFDEKRESLEIVKSDFHTEMKKMNEVIQGTKLSTTRPSTYRKAIEEKKSFYYDENNKHENPEIKQNVFENFKVSYSFSIPIIYNNKVSGIVYLYNVNKKIDGTKLGLVEEFINKYSENIILARDFYRLKIKETDMAGLLEKNRKIIGLAEKINSLESADLIYTTVLVEMLQLFNYDIAFLFLERDNICKLIKLKTSDKNKFEKIINDLYDFYAQNHGGYKLDPPEGATGLAYSRKTHFYFEDVTPILNYEMHYKDKGAIERMLTPKSLIMAPLTNKGKPIGVLHMWGLTDIVKLSQNDIGTINSLCAFIGTAITNAEMYTQLAEQRKVILESKNEIEKINEISKQISLSLDYSSVFDKVANYLSETYGFEGCLLYVTNEDLTMITVDKFTLPESLNEFTRHLTGRSYPLKKNEGNIANCVFNKKTYYFPEVSEDIFGEQVDKLVVKMLNIKTLLNIPILIGEKPVGLFSLSSHSNYVKISEQNIESIKRFVNQISITLKNSKLYDEIKTTKNKLEEKDKIMSEDLSMAKRIQQSILSADNKGENKIDFSIYFEPMIEVGGDIYDVFQLNPGYYRIFIADATGHGVQGALSTMIIKIEYDKIKTFEISPDIILQLLNNVFVEGYSNINMVFTCAILDIDIQNGYALFASAGHPAQYLLTNGKIEKIHSKGKIIGVLKDMDCEIIEKKLDKDSRFLLFTDGLTETFNEKKEEFGEERLAEILKTNNGINAEDFKSHLLEYLKEFRGNEPVNDDTTIIVVDY